MFIAAALAWLACGAIAAWRHLVMADDRQHMPAIEGLISVLLLLSGPGGLLAHALLFRRQ
jgi:hypothetical protein